MRRECRERFPRHQFRRKPPISDPGMYYGTCVTHVPRCMSGTLTCGGGQNITGIPGTCAICNFTYLVRGQWCLSRLVPASSCPHGLPFEQISNFIRSLFKLQFKLGHGWVISANRNIWHIASQSTMYIVSHNAWKRVRTGSQIPGR